MKCPFIVNTKNEYVRAGDEILLSETKGEYAECVGDDCPYYYLGSCSRVDED